MAQVLSSNVPLKGQGSNLIQDIDSLRLRVREGLLPFADVLSAPEIKKVEEILFKNHSYLIQSRNKGRFNPESNLFDYLSKTEMVVDYFSKDGLTRDGYLKACVKQPPLFFLSANRIISNVERVIAYFREGIISRADYLKACVKQPALFFMVPDTIIANVESVIAYFGKDGLCQSTYLSVCLKQPSLFCLQPQTVTRNVEEVVRHFKKDDLTKPDYLKACLSQVQLFYQSSKTIIGNVEAVLAYGRNDRVPRSAYLKACTRLAPLFCLSARTILRHVRFLELMVNLGLLPRGTAKYPFHPLWNAVLKNPAALCLSDDNYILRLDYGIREGKILKNFMLLNKTRKAVEKEYQQKYGPFSIGSISADLRLELEHYGLLGNQ